MEWHGAYKVKWVLDGRIKASEVAGSIREAVEIARYWHKKGAHSIEVWDHEGKHVKLEPSLAVTLQTNDCKTKK